MKVNWPVVTLYLLALACIIAAALASIDWARAGAAMLGAQAAFFIGVQVGDRDA